MKRLILLLFVSIIQVNAFSQLDNYRNLYFSAQGEAGIKSYYNGVANANESNAVFKAYKGVATAMYAEVVSGVDEKFSYFGKGKQLIEDAIQADFWNPEIRFLRYSVQAEVPWIVNYSSNLNEDANIILNALKSNQIDFKTDFWKKAIKFILSSGELSSSMQNEFKKYQV